MNLLVFFGFLSFGVIYFIVFNQTKNRLNLFLCNHIEISNQKSLCEYKELARYCMYHALVGIGAALGAFFLLFFSFMVLKSQIFSLGLPLILLMVSAGKISENLEKKAQSLPCSNRQIEGQYKKITETWKKKALPDF